MHPESPPLLRMRAFDGSALGSNSKSETEADSETNRSVIPGLDADIDWGAALCDKTFCYRLSFDVMEKKTIHFVLEPTIVFFSTVRNEVPAIWVTLWFEGLPIQEVAAANVRAKVESQRDCTCEQATACGVIIKSSPCTLPATAFITPRTQRCQMESTG